MNKWDDRFLSLAELISTWSKDPSTQVGCSIVDEKQRVISLGFNGPPRGVADNRLHDREVKYRHVIHSEENALLFATRSVEGATCYVWPLPPCASCSSKLIQSGIARVVAPLPPKEYFDRQEQDIALAYALLQESGVVFSPVMLNDDDFSNLLVERFYTYSIPIRRF
ncbi:MAG: dCMP deaminase family protein [Gammaproteobacteria bacterium]|nr:dCMP deaminase family protein [Gammaproteobacteria bacterium]